MPQLQKTNQNKDATHLQNIQADSPEPAFLFNKNKVSQT